MTPVDWWFVAVTGGILALIAILIVTKNTK